MWRNYDFSFNIALLSNVSKPIGLAEDVFSSAGLGLLSMKT
jgi:hypothetical protein